ncbi:aminotransferase class I/II-fold pyridoxal phosphate-dependent enzyme [Nocardia sp. NBC_00565]|uniref:aminotransferase class I/II-fold pyridoxal phosphate-dependent enzyme n=1 Tax=Nocardia sp. NBC_00565 TaxID=2975993 RepID=UPI002E814733|nr:aminotransferase class I/II-fold pyridoxal phosphate-dependent enzyme [Nocardia sp. NBC_00565]WUC06389.1 aminotransferase class I/II-fold pyridoxal phosphate-dependent enzyme [Nocardia sp. NBC_00565]
MTDIAIVGLDCRFPQAPDPAALWQLLIDGRDVISEVPSSRWNADDFHDPAGAPGTINTRSGGFIDDADAFDHDFFGITPREAEAMDPQQRLLMQATWRAFEDATLDPRAQSGSRTGVFVGVMANEWANLQMSDYAAITPQHGSGNGYFMTANRLSYQFDLKGPSLAVDTACSSSLVAVHLACAALASGECDQAVAGGVNLVLTPAVGVFYTQAGLSAPDARCKPFSGNADGIVRGEGVAVLVLRRLADAQAAGLPIYAVIKGSAVNSDGRSNGITAPNRWAQQQVIGEAYQRAGVRPEDVDFIEAHGTGTVLGDMIEVKALGQLHAKNRGKACGIGSIKGNLGHTEGAAGVAGLIKVALSLHHGVVAPSRFAEQENPQLRMAQHGLRLLAEPMPLEGPAHGGVSSFGIGGTNAHIVLASAPAIEAAAVTVAPSASGSSVLTLSSDNAEGLRRNALRLADVLESVARDQFAQLCWTSNRVKSSGRSRLAIVTTDRDDAIARLRDGAESSVAAPVSVGWMFTGQGSQFPGMAKALGATSPSFRRALATVDDTMTAHLGRSVRDLLLDENADIDRTELAQPAIFAMEYALAQSLADAGVRPTWLIGHSIGEFAAAAVAGVFGLDDACRLVVARGRLMQRLPEGGAMLAVHATTAEVSDLLADEPEVALAAVNGPRDLVLSGTTTAIARIRAALESRRMTAKALNVSHAFHSPLMAPMLAEFEAIARECTYSAPNLPIYSTVRGRLLSAHDAMDAAYWTEHVRATVRFGDAIEAALGTEPTHVIEVGPRRVLAPLVGRMWPDLAGRCLALSPGPGATGRELADAIAAIYRDGLDPDWDQLYEPEQRIRRRLPVYEFATEHRFWVEPPTLTTPSIPSEETTMDQLIALFREQNAVLASFVAAPTERRLPQAGAAQAVVPQPVAAPAALAPDTVAGIVHAELARVSGFPIDRLRETQTLSDGLGFDSLMLTDLFAGLIRKLPGLTIDPTWFTAATTLGDVVTYVMSRLADAPGGTGGTPAPTAMPATTTTVAPNTGAPGPNTGALAGVGRATSPATGISDPIPNAATHMSAAAPRPTAVAPEYQISAFAEVKAIADRLSGAEALGLSNPYFLINDGVTRDTSVIDGTPVVNFSSYNYLGMSGHPAVVAAVQDAVARYGSSVSASRVLSGEKPVHRELEAELAALLGTEDAIALVGGHSTNVTIIGHIVGPQDLVIHDSLAHDSILQGCKLSGATRRPFPHNDHAALDGLLTEIRHQYRRVLILIEGVYSQDGDIPDLPAIIEIKKKHRALLMIDEAHSIGVLGATGGGIGEYFGVDRCDVELWSGTMSKALAGCGGYVAGSAELIRFLKYTTPGFVYSVGMTPMNAAASLAAMRQLRADREPLERLRHNSQLFLRLARDAGIDTGDSNDTPVIPCIIGDSLKTLKLSNALLRRGINVNPIIYPAVPEDLARLRFFVTACHTEDQIHETVKTLTEELALVA